MDVRCKMRCTEVGETEGNQFSASFVPVTSGSKENETFFKYTPAGELKLKILNNKYFEPGKEYYIDIIPE